MGRRLARERMPDAAGESAVVIGVDPHKESHTAAALDERQRVLGQVRVAATRDGYRQLLAWAAAWPRRRWAVENAAGLGRSLAQRLLADGEAVVDVPPKLSARVRLLSTGHGRKTDAADAVSTAVAARGPAELRPAAMEGHATTLGLLSERRDDLAGSPGDESPGVPLVARRTQTLNRLHVLLAEPAPGRGPAGLSADRATALLRRLRPQQGPQRTRRALAADLAREVRRPDG